MSQTKKLLYHVNLKGNSIKEGSWERLATAPVAGLFDGRTYWDTALKKTRTYNATTSTWASSGSTVVISSGTAALSVDNTDPLAPELTIIDASAGTTGLMTGADFDKLAAATSSGTANTIMLRDATGAVTATAITITGTPTNGNDAATKSYVDNIVASGMKVIGGISCAANPNYPAAVVGDAHYVTVAGKIGGAAGINVEKGDLLLNTADASAGDEATVGASWLIMERNADLATSAVAGLVRLATGAEITAGTATDAIPTVADVSTLIDNATAGNSYSVNIASGSTSYTINHSLNASVIVQVFDNTTGEYVDTTVTKTDANNVTVEVSPALTNSSQVLCAKIKAV